MADEHSTSTETRYGFVTKIIEAQMVASVPFRGVLNVASRMWMVRDWATRRGYRLLGPPCCVFGPDGGDPHSVQCEIQWRVGGVAEPADDEIGVRWMAPRLVLAAHHRGQSMPTHAVAHALRRWGQAQGYRMRAERREVYHTNTKTSPEQQVIEIQLFVEEDT